MDAENIAAWKNAKPFRPFVLRLNSDEAYEVKHPEALAFSPDTPVLVLLLGAEGVVMIGHEAVLAINHLSKLTRKKSP
jgi:hypothetical protein